MTNPRPAHSTPPVPGTITALRVLLGLSAAGNVMAVLMALVVAAVASSFASTLTPGLDDDTSTTLHGLGSALLLLALLVAVFTAVELWAVVAIAARRRAARTAITVVQVADLLVAPVVVAAVGVEVLVPMLLALPFGVTMLVLAWVPADSRRWFDGTPAPDVADDAPTVVLPLPRPIPPGPRRLQHR